MHSQLSFTSFIECNCQKNETVSSASSLLKTQYGTCINFSVFQTYFHINTYIDTIELGRMFKLFCSTDRKVLKDVFDMTANLDLKDLFVSIFHICIDKKK